MAALITSALAGPQPVTAAEPQPAAAAEPAVGPAAQWAQDGYGPGNTGYNPDESVVNAATITKLKPRWTATAGPGSEGCQQPSVAPLVVAGRMFRLDSGGVGAYDARTGKRLWLYTAGYLEATGLAVVGGHVIVTDVNCRSTSNYDSNVIALDVKTGAERWNELSNWTTDTIAAAAGVIVVSGFCGTCDDAEHGVDAFRATDGARLWTRDNAVLAGPVAAGGRVLLTSTDTRTSVAVSIKTGSTLWRTSTAWTARAANPAGNRLYLSNATGLRAVHAATGKVAWKLKSKPGDLAADGRRVYLAATGRINAYDARTGRALWTQAVSGPGRPIRAGGLLYTVTKNKTLTVLSPVNGKPIPAASTGTGLTGHIVAAGGVLYTTSGQSVRAYTP